MTTRDDHGLRTVESHICCSSRGTDLATGGCGLERRIEPTLREETRAGEGAALRQLLVIHIAEGSGAPRRAAAQVVAWLWVSRAVRTHSVDFEGLCAKSKSSFQTR